ncbi:MAG: MFS transporter, partial [Chloroflexota bacterium]|nr:MFS transporter [Chloroflexota bacterium]
MRADGRSQDRAATFWLRSGYWWVSAATASLIPYLSVHYRELGYSGPQIGVLLAVMPLGTALLAPLWGAAADALGAHRTLLQLVLLAAAAAALALSRVEAYPLVLLLLAVLAVCTAPVQALFDSYGVTLSGRTGIPYGRLRIWGSLGYIAAAWVVGRLMGGRVTVLFFGAYAACLSLGLVSAFGLPRLTVGAARRGWGGASRLLRDRRMLLLLLTAYCVWSSTSIMYSYIGLLIERLGGDARIIGASYALSATSELPVFALSGWFLSRIGSSRMLLVASAVYSLRFLTLSLVPSAGWVLAVQLVHGLTYGFFVLASVTLVH